MGDGVMCDVVKRELMKNVWLGKEVSLVRRGFLLIRREVPDLLGAKLVVNISISKETTSNSGREEDKLETSVGTTSGLNSMSGSGKRASGNLGDGLDILKRFIELIVAGKGNGE